MPRILSLILLALWLLPVFCIASAEDTNSLKCTIALMQVAGAELNCKINATQTETETDTVLTEKLLRDADLSDYATTVLNQTVDEYAHPIIEFRLEILGTVIIAENAFKALPDLTTIHFHGRVARGPGPMGIAVSRVDILAQDEFLTNTPRLKQLRMDRVIVTENNTLAAIRKASGLESLIMNYGGLTSLEAGLFEGLNNLTYLSLEFNNITTIDAGAFRGIHKVGTVSLVGSRITHLPPGLFQELKYLKKVDLAQNNLKSALRKETLSGMNSVEHLLLAGNQEISFDNDALNELTNLKILDLRFCGIHTLTEGIFDNLKNLEYLLLSMGNVLERINSTTFRGLKSLKKLSLQYCQLNHVEAGAFDDLVSLRWLQMDENAKLKTLPNGLFDNNVQLESVSLTYTCISENTLSRNANFSHCPNLQSLKLGRDCTEDEPWPMPLPDSSTNSTNKTELNCHIAWLQAEGRELTCRAGTNATKEVILSEDALREATIYDENSQNLNYTVGEYPHDITAFGFMPQGNLTIEANTFKVLPKLNTLHVHGDKPSKANNYQRISTLNIEEGAFMNAPNLKTLRLHRFLMLDDGTPLSPFRAIRSAVSLESLTFLECGMGTLNRSTFAGLIKLQFLGIHESSAKFEEGAFEGLVGLKSVSMQENDLGPLPDGLFQNSSKLSTIDIQMNRGLKISNETLRGLDSLSHLALTFNDISILAPGVFAHTPNLSKLDLRATGLQDQLPDGVFEKMPKLSKLNLARNHIRRITSTTFRGLRKLESLLMGYNIIIEVEAGAFDDLINIRHIEFGGTRLLHALPDGLFDKMEKLEVIDFSSTCVLNLSAANFTHCPNLKKVLAPSEDYCK